MYTVYASGKRKTGMCTISTATVGIVEPCDSNNKVIFAIRKLLLNTV